MAGLEFFCIAAMSRAITFAGLARQLQGTTRRAHPLITRRKTRRPRLANRGSVGVTTIEDAELDARIQRVVERLLARSQSDTWHDARSAAAHLKLSRAHFLRVCNGGLGPAASGKGRMRRWRERDLDEWQTHRESGDE
jgi:hypothetical protein